MAAEQEIKIRGTFGVRNDKFRGLLVESLETSDGNHFIFKFHDQPIAKHCLQLQTIVKAANILRAKKLNVDMTGFLHEYLQLDDKSVVFRGTKLPSVVGQIEKVYTTRINKEIGIMKRQANAADKRQAKVVAKNAALRERYNSAEAEFQAERARRIDQLFGTSSANRGSGCGPSGGQDNRRGLSVVQDNGRGPSEAPDKDLDM